MTAYDESKKYFFDTLSRLINTSEKLVLEKSPSVVQELIASDLLTHKYHIFVDKIVCLLSGILAIILTFYIYFNTHYPDISLLFGGILVVMLVVALILHTCDIVSRTIQVKLIEQTPTAYLINKFY